MADTVDHTQGDTGTKPPNGLDFQSGGFPEPEEFDWFWSQVPSAINDHANLLEAIDTDEDGVVDEATTAQSATSYKGNDIDSDGDGKVDSAESADTATTADTATVADEAKAFEVRTNDPSNPDDGQVWIRSDL